MVLVCTILTIREMNPLVRNMPTHASSSIALKKPHTSSTLVLYTDGKKNNQISREHSVISELVLY